MALLAYNNFDMEYYTKKQYSQFPPVHDFRKPWWGVAYVPCMTNLLAFYAWLIRWHVTCMLSLAGHWQGWRALSNHVCAHSVISMWHVVCLHHLARASSEQSRSTTVLPINHVIQMPQCLSGFVNHDYSVYMVGSCHLQLLHIILPSEVSEVSVLQGKLLETTCAAQQFTFETKLLSGNTRAYSSGVFVASTCIPV